MILDKYIDIKVSNKYINKLKENNIIFEGLDIIKIPINILFENSSVKVDVECDICHSKNKITFQKYNKNIQKQGIYTCKKCFNVKNKQTSLDKYGIENYNNREKSKQTCLDKYKVENVSQLEEIKNKKKNTSLKNYGVTNISNSIIIQNKKKETMIEKNKYKIKNLIDYDGNIYKIHCENCKTNYEIKRTLLKTRLLYDVELCTVCNPINSNVSDKENKLLEFIKEKYDGEIIENSRNIIKPYELDIYLPDLKLAFEFNGVYWHNELYKEKTYHLEKTELCLKNGIQLIHIWEDDWNYKQEIVKSMILNKLVKTPNKIYARKCEIKEITDNKLINFFLEKNHIQGFIDSIIKIGLFYENELVSLITFGKKRIFISKEKDYELISFCNKLNTNVIGGASKLFKYFTKKYIFSSITTYVDRSHSQGKLYEKLGFNFLSKTSPNYYYVINGIRIKSDFDSSKTERKIYRIFDSGYLKYKMKENERKFNIKKI